MNEQEFKSAVDTVYQDFIKAYTDSSKVITLPVIARMQPKEFIWQMETRIAFRLQNNSDKIKKEALDHAE